MKILVTGGAGFIGSHIVDACIDAGHQVIIIDDLSTGQKEFVNPRATFIKMDIRDKEVGDIFKEEQFNIVNHHAAQMDVRKSVDDPLFDASVNVLGTLNLLENCKRFGVKKFIFASTGGAIYGEQDYFPADEQHPVRPLSPYGVSKLAIEKYLFYYLTVFGLEHVVLRYANVYGPRQNPHGEAGVIAIFSTKMLSGGQPFINGDGKQTRDYVFVKDVVRANILALDMATSDTFNIGTAVETDVNTLFAEIQHLSEAICRQAYSPAKKGEQRRSVLTSEKIQRMCGWSPGVRLQDGLRQTVEFFSKRC